MIHVLFYIDVIPENISENAVKAADCFVPTARCIPRGDFQDAVDDIRQGPYIYNYNVCYIHS